MSILYESHSGGYDSVLLKEYCTPITLTNNCIAYIAMDSLKEKEQNHLLRSLLSNSSALTDADSSDITRGNLSDLTQLHSCLFPLVLPNT